MQGARQIRLAGGGVGGAVRCALVGDEPLVAQCAAIALDHGLEVVLVATTNSTVADDARARGVPVVRSVGELGAGLEAHPADVLLSIANLRLIADDVLARVQLAINYHDGPLPGYAGLNVTTWALLAGEDEHAITWHLMTTDVDAGEVVATEAFPISDDESGFSLNARCYEAALDSFPRVAAALAAGVVEVDTQPGGPSRMFLRHDRPALVLDPGEPAAVTAREVRALSLGHRLRNSIGVVRWVVGDDLYVVEAASAVEPGTGAAPGSILAIEPAGVRLATSAGDLLITDLTTPEGVPVSPAHALERAGLAVGSTLPALDGDRRAELRRCEPDLSRHESYWLDRLCVAEPSTTPLLHAQGTPERRTLACPSGVGDDNALAVVAAWLARITGTTSITLEVTDPAARRTLSSVAPFGRPGLVRFEVTAATTFADLVARASAELEVIGRRQPLLRDAVGRDPRTRGHDLSVDARVEVGEGAGAEPLGTTLRIAVTEGELVIEGVPADEPQTLDRIVEQLGTLLAAGTASPSTPVGELPLLGHSDVALLDRLNDTALDHDRSATITELFHAQVDRTPDDPALSVGSRALSYAELEAAADALADRLAAAGVARGDRVGIAVPRGVDMVLGVLATLELGAAYLPLDPSYPPDRLGFMVADAGIKVLLATGDTAAALGRPDLQVVDPGSAATAATPPRVPGGPRPDDLAYLIYTSGSTGVPKGVMLEHRQVVNFFDAMDQVLDPGSSRTWLAVTSLSFDISVLELLWTITRGFHVVLKTDSGVSVAAGAGPAVRSGTARPVTFSLFYFAAGEDTAADGYRLLLESARFADHHGFEAVWTPERHFHAFGGAYPNPSVVAGALAAITEHVAIRAGSVVLPLHSPIRVAEEWAVVDNLSRGRVGISFAAGWQPNDFVLNPTAYATAKADLPERIELVQRLWRGETVALPGHDGAPVDVRTLPRPVQSELPVWLTSAGTPATFERAGMLGTNVLTHLLGQSVEQLAENIARYRAAWTSAGHPGEGRVTLMLHTYLDRDGDTAREVAREPMKAYLGTAVGLLRDVASAFPTFANRGGKGNDDLFKSLSAEELDQLLEVAAHRYLGTSGLFGTAADAADIVEQVSAAGVDEVACLIDFGVETDDVLASLDLLLDTKRAVDERRPPVATTDGDVASSDSSAMESVASLVAQHGVTHLQCTPSLAAMLVADPDDRAALGHVGHLMLGGEALPVALAAELRALLPGRFTNMYGPTETTIWSLTHEIDGPPGPVMPIGTPIANTTVHVLDPHGRPLPIGVFGELHIGGEGVARGYHDRPELTAERFVDRPGMGRVYDTGDVVRVHPAGHVEFAGRADNQVKIRGHRIELGEIEGVIDRHPEVVQSVVVAKEGRGDPRLVAYVVVHHGALLAADAIRQYVAAALPEAMVPSGVVRLDAFPMTPNGKIDRKALPEDTGSSNDGAEVATAPPADDVERLVAAIWTDELERPVGRDDNFFDIGGHSLLAVRVFRRITDETGAALSLTDVFRFPTVRAFAAHLAAAMDPGAPSSSEQAPDSGSERGARRRRALGRRGGSSS